MNLLYLWSKIVKKIRGASIRNSNIHPSSKVEPGSQVVNTTFGRHTFCGYDCQIINCTVGAFTSISDKVVIGGGMHPMSWVGMSPVFYAGKDSVKRKYSRHERQEPQLTTIGNDVWIGHGALIKQGVIVGDGAVVGMGSVVTRNVPPYAIVAGSPARLIRMRFNDHIVKTLVILRWWNWEDAKLERYAHLFNDIESFVRKLREERDVV